MTRSGGWGRGGLAAGLAAAAVAVWFCLAEDSEPICQGRTASQWIRQLTRAENIEASDHALNALHALGPAAVNTLVRRVRRRDPMLLKAALRVVPQVPWLRPWLARTQWRRTQAVAVLGKLGPEARDAVPALIDTLRDPDDAVPPAVLEECLIGIGRNAAQPLILALSDKCGAVRLFAAAALCELIEARGISAPDQMAALAPLVKTLRDKTATQRRLAAVILGRLGPRARPAVIGLLVALSDPDEAVRAQAAEALSDIAAPRDPPVIAPLMRALVDPTASVRAAAALALERFGPAARAAAMPLCALLTDSNETVRVNAANALGRISEGADAVAPLVGALHDPSALVRASAALALGKAGTAALPALSALLTVLQDPDAQVRSDAARALGRLGPAAWAAVAPLMRALRDDDYSVRICAIQSLGEIGPPASAAVPALRQAALNDFSGTTPYVGRALRRIAPTSTGAAATGATEQE